MWWRGAVLFFTVGLVAGQQIASDCPLPNGYFADAVQCDLYYECVEGVITEKLCPDGFVFNDLNSRLEKCDFPFQVNCEGRPELQTPKSTDVCPRANGYFPHANPSVCNEFYYCTDGVGSKLTCPEGLAFSIHTGTCVWPNQSGRTGCSAEKVTNFTCPEEPLSVAVAHPRYPDSTDCQYFYVCINGETPRRSGCAFGEVFNPEIGACGSPKDVIECKDYYIDYFKEYFTTLGTGSSAVAGPDIIAAAIASGFEVPKNIVRLDPDVKIKRRRPAGGSTSSVRQSATEAPEPAVARRPAGRPERPAPRPAARPAAEDPTPAPARRRPGPPRRRATTTTPPPPPPEDLPADYYYYDYADAPEGANPAAGGV
ncbi:protein obstructor-E-like [Oratosquilla oratoria]|uniref:protein obstructor-E-like n=1 Tax=Oratosquilla oratoria TaxID=337810 RepID=UPI003F772A3D